MIELGVILALLMGWQFTLAEFVGGPIIIILVALLFVSRCARGLFAKQRNRLTKGWSVRWRGTPRWTCPWAATRASDVA